jgi:uncharacterized protein
MIPTHWVPFLRKHQITIFVVLMLVVQCAAAAVVKAGLMPRGFFEWSFLAKPGIALALIYLVDGADGFTRVMKSLVHVRLNWRWYAIAVLGMPAILLLTVYVYKALTGTLHTPVPYNFWSVTGWYPKMWTVMLTMCIADELAFFSFTYTRLAPRFTGINAALVTAFIWTLSYAPRLIMESDMLADATMPYWVLGAFFFTVAPICAWVYGSTKSGFLLVLLQLVANFGTLMLPILPGHTGTIWVYVTQSAIMAIVSGALAVVYGPKTLKAEEHSFVPA